jgi:hypothetical protein
MSGDGSDAVPLAPLPAVPIDADVMEIIDKCGIRGLAPAMAAVECQIKLDKQTLNSLGLGSTKGVVFFDLNTAEAKRDWMLEYAKQLLTKDKVAFVKTGRDRGFKNGRDRILCVCRILRDMLEMVAADRLPGATTTNKITVIQGDAEDNAYSKEFDGTWLEQQIHMAWVMYRRSFVAGILPKHAVLKKFFYSISVEKRLTSITRVSLKSLRVDPLDSATLILKRYLVGHFLCGVGACTLPEMEPFGHGDLGYEFPVQFISWHDCQDMLDTCEAEFPGLDDTVALAIVETIITSMVTKTGAGHSRMTASAAIGRTMHEINQITANAKISARAVRMALLEQGDGDEPTPKKTKLGEAEPRMGPNGLERKKGGNDAGKPCIDFEKGKCPRNKCSFKHAKGDTAEEE